MELHPYDVPEVVELPIERGHGPYLDWIERASASRHPSAQFTPPGRGLREHRSARSGLISRDGPIARLKSAFTNQSRAPGAPSARFGCSAPGVVFAPPGRGLREHRSGCSLHSLRWVTAVGVQMASRARARSATRSSASSQPTLMRTSPSVIPSRSRSSWV